ncbi:type II toxin-antitoxin system PemK/MazF family toxin [Bradyrhizobium sp. BWA-3-5]|uniref:type II toxin-antitoxin system PemK/MazF family toxin n=1 Tax=Bradyrhizobium sp. BWA-3-5 TaxID=3080013 RepID=UPI00293E6AAE|nr:type II toxin-antitoxin system PemK/MazF family toxin [Bradyrhizobium sp. BWA-3-5]WOH70199.1 type II toxin-antitoxin system PemK/MazF family toxin [Bradyrhizobium sp. BWA-3-5]
MAKSTLTDQSATKSGEPYCPDRGDIIWLNFHPQAGREQDGWRPALVLSPKRYNQFARLCVACPITSQDKLNNFQVELPDGCGVTGWVISDQVKSISWFDRRSQHRGRATDAVIAETIAKIRTLIPL